jgi:UDP-2,4-diacetamido-2,4,6-trideoxy-beta-L-altropyranose hydrolase
MKEAQKARNAGKCIVLRADASATTGGGHIMRCLSLAETLAEAGWSCCFVVRAGSEDIVPQLNAAKHRILPLEESVHLEAEEMRRRIPQGCNLLLVDHYGLDEGFEERLSGWADRIVVIDDLADRRHHCHLLIDSALERDAADYLQLVPENCRILTGPAYAMLRREFVDMRDAALARREQTRHIRKIFVNFGAADSKNLTPKVLRALDAVGPLLEVSVVVGARYAHLEELQNGLTRSRHQVRLHVNPVSMASLMSASDFSITAAGSSSWERCCLGLPGVLLITASNQELLAHNLCAAGCALWGGRWPDLDLDRLVKTIVRAVESPQQTLAMGRKAAGLCDGRGNRRIALQFEAPRSLTDGGKVSLRLAVDEDCDLIYRWQTTPGIRRFFRNPRPPALSEHRNWFRKMLASPDHLLHTILLNGQPAGILRLDRVAGREKDWEVSILVRKSFQNRGVGRAALLFARSAYPYWILTAEVMTENLSSQKAFLQAGYRPLDSNRLVSEPMRP